MKKTKSSAKSAKKRTKAPDPTMPMVLIGAAVLLVLIIAVASSGSSNTAAVSTVAEVNRPSKKSQKAEVKKTVLKTEIKKSLTAAPKEEAIVTETTDISPVLEVKAQDTRSLQNIKVEIRQLTLEKKWTEAMSVCDKYEGPHSQSVAMLRREIIARQENYQEIAAADKEVKEELRERPVAKAKAPVKKFINKKEDQVVGFTLETAADRAKKKSAPAVTLMIHSKIVGLSKNVIVVWKTRDKVLSYSRLIKACENKKSKFYNARIEKAKQYLKENRESYELIPYAKAKMTLRRKGFTVSEIFFNQTLKENQEEYIDSQLVANTKSTTARYKGYIISYDIKPPSASGGFGMGC
jgi:hypothetical protein